MTRRHRSARPGVVGVSVGLILTIVAGACASAGSDRAAPGDTISVAGLEPTTPLTAQTDPPTSPTEASSNAAVPMESVTAEVLSVLARAGASVVEATNPSVSDAIVTFTTGQARVMADEAERNAGVLGADLDAAGGGTTSGLPMSAVIAGYVRGVDAPGAVYSRKLLAGQDLTHPEQVVFPTLVLALFASDAASAFAADDLVAQPLKSNTTAADGFVGASALTRSLALGPCSEVTKTVFDAVDKIFAKIHIPPGKVGNTGSSFLNGLLQGLTDVVVSGLNFIIDAARTLVIEGVKFVLGQVLSIVAEVAAGAALVANFVSLVRPWSLDLVAKERNTRKGVGSEMVYDQATATAVILGPTNDWPAWFEDCAKVAGVTLPSLLPVDAPVTWKVESYVRSANLMEESVHEIQKDTKLRKEGTGVIARIGLVTGTESQEMATKGAEQHGPVLITATARRNQITEIRAALTTAIRNIADRVLQAVPSAIREYLLGLVSTAADSGSEQLASLLDARGTVLIDVLYHGPPPPEQLPVTPVPPEPKTFDPCTIISDQEVMAVLGSPIERHERNDSDSFQNCIIGTARQGIDGADTSAIYYVSLTFGVGDLSMFLQGDEGPPSTTSLTGLGDLAVSIDGAGAVLVNAGSSVLFVQVVIAGVPAPSDVVIGIAKLALGRIG